MSNREAGGSSALSGYRNYYNPGHIAELEQLWNIAHGTTVITSNAGLQPTIPGMVKMMRNGTPKVHWVACIHLSFGNPACPFVE